MQNVTLEADMEKKYKLTNETINVAGYTLHRIKALRDFGNVKAGDLGGFVKTESNLSHEGNCWVYDNACVFEQARVYGQARVFGQAKVLGEAWVSGQGEVLGEAWVSGQAEVYGEARVSGDMYISNNNDYATISNFGTENRTTTFALDKNKNVVVKCGCFYGTIDEFREQVKKTREGYIAEEYLMVADLMEFRFKNRVR